MMVRVSVTIFTLFLPIGFRFQENIGKVLPAMFYHFCDLEALGFLP